MATDHVGTKVFVYWNLHKGLWSVKALNGPQKGRVIDRTPYIMLHCAHPRVSEAGRQRVLREQRKNVHAGIVGYVLQTGPEREAPSRENMEHGKQWERITYNPYKGPSFVYADGTGFEYTGSALVAMLPDRSVLV